MHRLSQVTATGQQYKCFKFQPLPQKASTHLDIFGAADNAKVCGGAGFPTDAWTLVPTCQLLAAPLITGQPDAWRSTGQNAAALQHVAAAFSPATDLYYRQHALSALAACSLLHSLLVLPCNSHHSQQLFTYCFGFPVGTQHSTFGHWITVGTISCS